MVAWNCDSDTGGMQKLSWGYFRAARMSLNSFPLAPRDTQNRVYFCAEERFFLFISLPEDSVER